MNTSKTTTNMRGVSEAMVREARRCVDAFAQFAGKSASQCDPTSMHLVLCEAHNALEAALSAQPAERGVEGWRVLQIGAVGSAYDPPNTRRAFTYDWQPGNGDAWALGKASSAAAKASAGDYIDSGLSLLKALQEQGFGVFQIEPAATPAKGESHD